MFDLLLVYNHVNFSWELNTHWTSFQRGILSQYECSSMSPCMQHKNMYKNSCQRIACENEVLLCFQISCHIFHTCMVSHPCVFSCVTLKYLSLWTPSYTHHTWMVSPLSGSSCDPPSGSAAYIPCYRCHIQILSFGRPFEMRREILFYSLYTKKLSFFVWPFVTRNDICQHTLSWAECDAIFYLPHCL